MSWTCPECKKKFRNRNQWHSCHILSVEDHLKKKSENVQETVVELLKHVQKFGPIEINPVKSTIQVKAGATFLSIKPKKDYVELEFQLGEKLDDFPIHRAVRISGNRVLHFVFVESPEDITSQLIGWMKSSYLLVNDSLI